VELGVAVVTGVGVTIGAEVGRLGVRVGVGVGVWQAAPITNATRRNNITKDFSITQVIYDLLLSKVNHDHIDKVDS